MRLGSSCFRLPRGELSKEAYFGPLLVLLFGIAYGSTIVFPGTFFQLDVSLRWLVVVALSLAFPPLIFRSKESVVLMKWLVPSILLIVFGLSNIPVREHGFSQANPSPILICLSVGFGLMCSVGLSHTRLPLFYGVILFVTGVAGSYGLYTTASSSMIFSDDHPPFLYRLIQLRDNFPSIPFYNPSWNGGVEAREFFPSGVLNFFLLMSPLLYFVDITTWYTALIIILLFGLAPLSAFVSGRIGGQSTSVCTLYATLALTSSLFWYRWALVYGTIGFIVAAILSPLNAMLLSHFTRKDGGSSFLRVALFVSTLTLMFLWSPSLLLFAPALLYGALSIRIALQKPWVKTGVVVAVLINAIWLSVFVSASNVMSFFSPTLNRLESTMTGNSATSAPVHEPSKFKRTSRELNHLGSLERVSGALQTSLVTFNPLVLLFSLPGLFLFRHRSQSLVFSCLISWAVVLGIVGPVIKPQLELERMFVVLAFLLGLPAAIAIDRMMTTPLTWRVVSIFVKAVPLGALSLMPFWMWRMTSNSTSEEFHVASPLVFELTERIRSLPESGRVMFAGFTLHELSGGHVAPLADWTKKPLVASSYQHDKWAYTDVVPLEFRQRKTPGVLEFLNLMNVTTIVTHDSFWGTWYSLRPKHFTKIWENGRFKMFQRLHPPSGYIYEGKGEVVTQDGNSIVLSAVTSSLVIKFNYLPFLTSDNCSISPRSVSPSVTFISLEGCDTSRPISIKSKGPIGRFFLGEN